MDNYLSSYEAAVRFERAQSTLGRILKEGREQNDPAIMQRGRGFVAPEAWWQKKLANLSRRSTPTQLQNRWETRGDVTVMWINRRDQEPVQAVMDTADFQERVLPHPGTWTIAEKRPGFLCAVMERPGHPAIFLHRVIAGVASRKHVEFRNGNGLDCRRSNLVWDAAAPRAVVEPVRPSVDDGRTVTLREACRIENRPYVTMFSLLQKALADGDQTPFQEVGGHHQWRAPRAWWHRLAAGSTERGKTDTMRNEYRIHGDVTEIVLRHIDGSQSIALISTADLDRVRAVPGTWSTAAQSKHLVYAGVWPRQQDGKRGRLLLMHRVIMEPPEGMEVDHINGNGLDNRRENLRIVTHTENMQNIHPRKSRS